MSNGTSPKAVKAMEGWLAKSRTRHGGDTAGPGKMLKPKISPTNVGNTSGGGQGPAKAKGNAVKPVTGIMKSVPGSKGK